MRIVVHGINFYPELVGVGKYSGEMTSWLAQRGHQISVVTAPPFNPQNRIWKGYAAWRYQREQFNSRDGKSFVPLSNPASGTSHIRIVRCPLWVSRKPNDLNRILHLVSFALSSWLPMLSLLRWRPDVVILVEPTFLCALHALTLARLSGAKVWLHVQDFELDAAFEVGNLLHPRMRRAVAAFERILVTQFDKVSTISRRMMDQLELKGVHSSRSFLFPNWVDTSVIYPLSRPSSFREELGISNDTIVALYAGSMGKKQGLELLVEVATRAAYRKDLLFVFCGDGANRENLARAVEGCSNVRLLNVQPSERLNELLNLADIHLLPQVPAAADLVMPSKLTGMLASGRPIIATAAPRTQLEEIVSGCGVVTPPGDPSAFLSALLDLAANKSLRLQLGNRARDYAVQELDSTRIMGTFERELMTLCQAHGNVMVANNAG